jgi:hypothetical protein
MRWLIGAPLRVHITKSMTGVSICGLAHFLVEDDFLGGMAEGA